MSGVDDLVRWLGEQLDIDAARATTAAEEGGPDWRYDGHAVTARREGDLVAVGSQDFMEPERGEHIAEWDPARVLAEINAKRRIIEQHTVSETSEFEGKTDTITYCPICQNDGECPTLRLLAAVYDDRPGYREEWRP